MPPRTMIQAPVDAYKNFKADTHKEVQEHRNKPKIDIPSKTNLQLEWPGQKVIIMAATRSHNFPIGWWRHYVNTASQLELDSLLKAYY